MRDLRRGGKGTRALHHLTHGVSVWLCAEHRSLEFQRRRARRDFVASLAAVWKAAGVSSRRHDRALAAHLARIRPAPPARRRPGSYAWAALREEAEARYRSGEDPRVVIRDLRHRDTPGASRPSTRTLRRWHTDGRWLTAATPPGSQGRRNPSPNPPARQMPAPAPTGSPGPRECRSTGPIRGPC